MIHRLRVPLLLSPLLLACRPDGEPRDLAPSEPPPPATAELSPAEALLALAEEARAAVAAHYGETAEQLPTPVLVVTREELQTSLVASLRKQFEGQFGEGEYSTRQLEQNADWLSRASLARYCHLERSVQICPENLTQIGALLQDSEFDRQPVQRAVLVHEFVHARDDLDGAYSRAIEQLAGIDARLSFNAVIEGHAQFVARAVCAAADWSDGFDRYTGAITALPPESDSFAERLAVEITVQQFGFAYHEGERFVGAVAAARGAASLPALWQSPPTEPAVILRPEWYLDPQSRPTSTVDLDRALDRFAELALPETFQRQRLSPLAAQVRVSLTGLDDERVDRLLLHLRSSRVELGMNQETGGEMRALGLLEFDSAVAADSALLVQRAMSELRDTQLQEGPVRIVSSRYGDLSGADGLRGFQVLKTVATPVGEQNVLTLVVVRGALQAEASSSCGDEPATIEAWLRAALAAAHGETPADAPAPDPESDLGNSAPAPQQTGG